MNAITESEIVVSGAAMITGLGLDWGTNWQAIIDDKVAFGDVPGIESKLPPGSNGAQASPLKTGKKLVADDLSILQMYDLFCCDYKNKEMVPTEVPSGQEDLSEESEFEKAISTECNIIVYGPPGTGKTYEVLSLIEDLDTNEKVGVQI